MGRSIWIELKSNDVKNLGLSKYQINWHLEHYQNKGTSFILRECLSQRTSKRFELWLVREPRNLVLAYSSTKLKEIFTKIQDA